MSEPVSSSLGLQSCPACGASLQRGFLLGKQNLIRWSSSPRAMTIFAGIPLVRLKRGFWHSWRWWLFAPSIPAGRCSRCQLVIFHYDNAAAENTRKEGIASVIIGALILFSAVAGFLVVAWIAARGPRLPPTIYALLLLILLPVCGVGTPFVIHGLCTLRSDKSLQGTPESGRR